jgi:hypothetical protein
VTPGPGLRSRPGATQLWPGVQRKDRAPEGEPGASAETVGQAGDYNSSCDSLATVKAILNLGTLGRNDASATPMSDLFRGGIT